MLEGERGDRHQRPRPGHHHERADPGVGPLVVDPARGDALVDHVRLLEEELPGRDGGAHDADDQQHRGRVHAAVDPRHEEVLRDLAAARVGQEEERDDQEVREHEHEHRALPAAEGAGDGDRDQRHGGDRHGDVLGEAEVAEREAHADELGDDREEVEQEEVADREEPPEAPEALVDELRVTDAGDRAEAHHHLLVDDQHGHEQQQHPHQRGAVVLAGLRVGGDAAGVVVADHHDQARADDRGEREHAPAQAAAMGLLVLADRAEGAADVADVGGVEHGALARTRNPPHRPRARIARHLLDLLSGHRSQPRRGGRWRPWTRRL